MLLMLVVAGALYLYFRVIREGDPTEQILDVMARSEGPYPNIDFALAPMMENVATLFEEQAAAAAKIAPAVELRSPRV